MFKSENYTRVLCTECNEVTIIEPGREIVGLNCKCNIEDDLSTEISDQFKTIEVYKNAEGVEVELLGVFANGDLEIKHTDGELAYRIKAEDFEAKFEKCELSLIDTGTKTVEELKELYTVEELREIARTAKIRGYSQMNEDNLIKALQAIKLI